MEAEKQAEGPTKLELKKLRRLEKKQARQAAAAEKKKKCVRDQLIREQNFTLETEKRVFKDWEQMCADVKFEDILEEMLQIKQNVQTVLDRKNFCIERLFGDRAEIEDIYSKHLQRLKRLIDCYLEIHQYFITILSKRYTEDCQIRLTEFQLESALKESHGNENVQQMEGALISLEEAMEQGLVDDRINFIKKNDENINFHIEKRDRLRDNKLQEMDQLYGEIKSVANNYFTTIMHPEKEKAYLNLFNGDVNSRRIIEANRAKIKELRFFIKSLNKKITEIEIAGTRKIMAKRLVKRNLEEEMDTLKRRFIKIDTDHMDRLKSHSYDVFHAQKDLNALLERGKLILSLAQCCRKLETEDDAKYFAKRIDQGHTSSSSNYIIAPECEFLFDKINRVRASRLLLRQERDQLLQTNRELQRQFQEYCKLNGSPMGDIGGLGPIVKGVE